MDKDLNWIPESWDSYKKAWAISSDFTDNLCRQIFGNQQLLSDDSYQLGIKNYLRQKLGERAGDYQMRLDLASFDGRLEMAVIDSGGLLAQHTVNKSLLPEEIAMNLTNVDQNTNNFEVWLNSTVIQLLIYGCWAWFVCFDKKHGWYLQWLDPDSIASPQYSTIENREILTAFSAKGVERIRSGFGYDEQEYYIRHELVEEEGQQQLRYRYSRWEKKQGDDGQEGSKYTLVPINGQQYIYTTRADDSYLSEFPLVWLNYKGKKEPLSFQYPFFSTLITLNRLHFNKESELNSAESNCNIQTLKRKHAGAVPKEPGDISLGTNSVIEIPNADQGGNVEWLEFAGTAIGITHQRNQDRSETMDRISKQFLNGGETVKTAFQVGVEVDASRSKLIAASNAIQDALQKTFRLAHQYTSPEKVPDNIVDWVQLKQEVLRSPISDEKARVLIELYNLGLLTKVQVVETLQRFNFIPNDISMDVLEQLRESESRLLPEIEIMEDTENALE